VKVFAGGAFDGSRDVSGWTCGLGVGAELEKPSLDLITEIDLLKKPEGEAKTLEGVAS
jgi:hypothetical protein